MCVGQLANSLMNNTQLMLASTYSRIKKKTVLFINMVRFYSHTVALRNFMIIVQKYLQMRQISDVLQQSYRIFRVCTRGKAPELFC